jgi:hypothetical protein
MYGLVDFIAAGRELHSQLAGSHQAHGTGQSVPSGLYFHLKLYSNIGISWQVAIGTCLTLSVLMRILVLHFLDLIVTRKLSKKIENFKTSLL